MSLLVYVGIGIGLLLFALFIFAMLVAGGRADEEMEREAQRRELWQAREKTEAEAARLRALVQIRQSVNRRVQ